MTRVKEYTAQYIRLTCLTGVTGQQRRAHQRRGCSGWRGIQASVQVSFSERLTSIVTSPEFWQKLTRDVSGLSQPRNARTYHTRSSTNGGMPATGGEVRTDLGLTRVTQLLLCRSSYTSRPRHVVSRLRS